MFAKGMAALAIVLVAIVTVLAIVHHTPGNTVVSVGHSVYCTQTVDQSGNGWLNGCDR
jgi:hypothetical protein